MKIDAYPRLARNSADYAHPNGYTVQMQQKERELEVIHRLEDVNTLPAQWLRDGSAHLCCEVRAPQMLYSRRFRCEHSDEEISTQGPLELRQLFDVPHASEKRMYFLPSIVLREARGLELSSATHGVSALWDRQYICFPPGAILAGGIIHEDPKSIVYPLSFERDDNLEAGTLSGSPRHEDESWHFEVRVPNYLLLALKDSRNHIWRRSIYIGCLAQMLVAVRKDFKEPESSRPPAVTRLGEMIQDMTQFSPRLSPPWDTDEDEWVDTLKIATLLLQEKGGLIAPLPEGNGA